jgi:hypothetical protein
MRSSFIALGLSLGLVANLVAQTEAETQRATLTGLRSFAVYARVQLSQSATLQRIDERVLRNKIEDALRREGIRVQTRNDMRDGSQASLDLLYMVIQTKDTSGHALGFAASSCLQASQMVRIPRLTTPKHIAYAVVSTWRSCGLLVGDSASLGPTILQNADEHIIRFIDAWRFANTPPPDPRFPATSELSMAGRQYRPGATQCPPLSQVGRRGKGGVAPGHVACDSAHDHRRTVARGAGNRPSSPFAGSPGDRRWTQAVPR